MSTKHYYTVSEAAELTGASKPSIRNYTIKLPRYFSTEATPEAGSARRFTEADLRLIAFVRSKSVGEAQTYDQIEQALEAGELDAFTWPGAESAQEASQATESASEPYTGALVPVERLQALDTLRQSAEQREAEALARLEQAEQQIRDLERQLGEAKGKLSGYRERQYRAPAWWRALFGGEAAE